MSDIVERAARVLYEHYRRSDGLDVTAQESAQALADAGLLRDNPAALLPPTEYNGELLCARCGVGQETGNRYHICADGSGWSHAETCEIYDYGDVFVCPPCEDEMRPARPTPTREELADTVQSMTRQVLLDAPEASADVIASNVTRAVLELLEPPTQDVYEVAAERSSTPSTGSVDAREVLGLPTRAQVMRAVAPVMFNASKYPRPGQSIEPICGEIADAVLELLEEK